jgi:hypothetical protein
VVEVVEVVDDINQKRVNILLFDVLLLQSSPSAHPPAPRAVAAPATPPAVEPNTAIATNLPILPLFFAKSC